MSVHSSHSTTHSTSHHIGSGEDEPKASTSKSAEERSPDTSEHKTGEAYRNSATPSSSHNGETPGYRKTEGKALKQLKKNGEVDPETQEALLGKLNKPQANRRGRAITGQTEKEYANSMDALPEETRNQIRQSVLDYTSDSSQINRPLRSSEKPSKGSAAGRAVDAVQTLNKHQGNPDRITYRLQSYPKGVHMPYGSKTEGKPTIKEGDYVQDDGFLSASQNRSFVKPGSKNAKDENHNVKFVIAGSGGTNIADEEGYSNKKEKAIFDQNNRKNPAARVFKTPEPGQAEIAYPPGTTFKVGKIKHAGPNETHVFLTAVLGESKPDNMKNLYDGRPVTSKATNTDNL